MKLYNIFSSLFGISQTVRQQPEEGIAHIKYYVTGDGVKIDVKLEDIDEKSIKYLSVLINTLYSPNFFKETVKIIEDFFIKEGDYDSLIKLYSYLEIDILKNKFTENAPYIKPSDMIK
jgi:hypothetical protein